MLAQRAARPQTDLPEAGSPQLTVNDVGLPAPLARRLQAAGIALSHDWLTLSTARRSRIFGITARIAGQIDAAVMAADRDRP